jgi:hypothetical protein
MFAAELNQHIHKTADSADWRAIRAGERRQRMVCAEDEAGAVDEVKGWHELLVASY